MASTRTSTILLCCLCCTKGRRMRTTFIGCAACVTTAILIVAMAIVVATTRPSSCRERFECPCRVNGRCPSPAYVRQGGKDACDLHNNYRTCIKNAQYGYATVVLNNGELIRRKPIPSLSSKQLRQRCLYAPDNTHPGFGCPGGKKPRDPEVDSDIAHSELCPRKRRH